MFSTPASRKADRNRLADIDAKISLLEESLHALRLERSVTDARLMSFVYPVLTLPNEIVSDVFLRFIPPYPRCPPTKGLRSPTVLTHICRKWREIALHTPALWSAIALRCSDFKDLRSHLPLAEAWLSRSGCLPLSIQLHCQTFIWPSHVADILVMLVSYRTRWEYVQFTLPMARLLVLNGSMPLLRDLYVSAWHVPTFGHDITPLVTPRDVPRLNTVTLRGFPAKPASLPWNQLTSLTLVYSDFSASGAILQRCSHLMHCTLIMLDEMEPQETDIHLPSLQSLALIKFSQDISDVPLTGYLEPFILPGLRRLQVPEECLGPDPIDTLAAFILKAGCTLDEVFITDTTSVSAASYHQAFPAIPIFSFDPTLTEWTPEYPEDFEEIEADSDSDSDF